MPGLGDRLSGRPCQVLLVLGLLSCGCAATAELPADMWVEQVEYAFDVSWAGAGPAAEGWVFTTDLGYGVQIRSWTTRTTSMELLPCVGETSWWLAWSTWGSAAHAHETYVHDPSVVEGPWQEDLVDPVRWTLGDMQVERQRYCDGFQVHAISEEGQMVTRLTGQYRAPGATAWVPFDASTVYGVTGLSNIGSGRVDPAMGPLEVEVVLTRYPVQAFDGLVLEELTAGELAHATLSALARDATLSWVTGAEAVNPAP